MAKFYRIMQDLTIVYISANVLPLVFHSHTYQQLLRAAQGSPIIAVTHEPMTIEETNIVVDLPRHQSSIYRQVLIGAMQAETKYVAVAEDDVLYSPEHFKFRPKSNYWGYNMNAWNIYTWGEPMFTYKAPGGRRNLNGLICERDLLVDHLTKRFELFPNEIDINIFGEPGKYDNQLGTTPYPSQDFYVNPPNIVFSHQSNLQFSGLGTRKALGQIRATEIPKWGTAQKVRSYYE
jgi:hypothetical protein